MPVTDERPPAGTPRELSEYLVRMFRKARLEDSVSDQFDIKTALPEKPVTGKLYYFQQIPGTTIYREGFYWYDATEAIWRYAGVSDFYFDVSAGLVGGHESVNKFGTNPSIDATQQLIWRYGGLMTYSTTADIVGISSTSAGDTQNVRINGLDTDWNEVDVDVTLNGQNKVTLGTSLIRIHKVFNIDSTDFAGDIYVYTSAATVTAGVPAPTTTIRAYITNGDNQTLQAAYSVPAGKTGYIIFGKTSVASGKDVVIKFYGRGFGSVFRVQHVVDVNSENYDYFFKVPLVMPEKTDLEVRATQSGGGSIAVSSAFDIILVDNPA